MYFGCTTKRICKGNKDKITKNMLREAEQPESWGGTGAAKPSGICSSSGIWAGLQLGSTRASGGMQHHCSTRVRMHYTRPRPLLSYH
jgi:hypothetical protein